MWPGKSIAQQLHERLISRATDAQFFGRVTTVGDECEEEPELELATPTPDTLTRLGNLPVADGEQRERRDDLRITLQAALKDAEEFIAEVMQEYNEKLEEQLEEVRKAGRAQMEVIRKLNDVVFRSRHSLREATAARDNARDHLNTLETTKVPRWASREDREKHHKAIEAAKSLVRQANSDRLKANQAYNAAEEDLGKAQEQMTAISTAEIRLRGELSGKQFLDPDLGLTVKPLI
jgi:hypothetical protein